MMTVANLTYGYQSIPWDSPLSLGVQAFIEYNGYIINDRHQADRIRVFNITGLDDSDITDSREVVPGDEGEFVYDSWARGRTFVMTGMIQAGSNGTLQRLQRDLKAAFGTLVESPMKFRWFDIHDTFDDPQTLQNYTAVIGSGSVGSLAPMGGVLRWNTTSQVLLMRSADNRLWADAQTTVRVIIGSVTDGSSVFIVPKLADTTDYIQVTLFPGQEGFPGTAILDNFNRTSENPLSDGGKWYTTTGEGGNPTGKTNGTQALSSTGTAGYAGSSWATPFSQPFQSFCDISVLPVSGFVALTWFITPGGVATGYEVAMTNGYWEIVRDDAGTGNTLIYGTATWSAGDSIGMEIYNGTISAWRKPSGGSWTLLGTVEDSTYTGSGYIGWSVDEATTAIDNFGGDVVPPGLSISTVIGGVERVLNGATIEGLVQGQSVWLRSKTEGDLVTAELWTSPPVETAFPEFSTTAWLTGSDADLLGDQVLSQIGFGAQTADTYWAFDDFRIESICPCDISFNAKKLSSLSIKDSQDSLSRFNRNFQITMRAGQPNAKCATQSRSLTLNPAPNTGGTTELGFIAPLTAPLEARAFLPGTVLLENNILSLCNRGTAPERPILVVYGAISQFSLSSLTNGMQLDWSGVLADGDYLVFDCQRRTLVNSIGSNMQQYLSYSDPRWMLLEPQWNDLYIVGLNYSSNTSLTAFARGRWK